MHKVFIGYDPRQAVSYSVLKHSIEANAKEPVQVIPLVIEDLPIKRQGLTPFTWSRFLVPYLCDYQGWALFCDADQMVQADINEVFALGKSHNAVHVMQDQPLFEWASMILFNCGHPANRILTPGHIDNPETKNLHKIGWVDSGLIGKLPLEWNVCVPYSFEGEHAQGAALKEPPANPKLIHFTQGVPHWWETADQPYADTWRAYRLEAKLKGLDVEATHTWWQLMGHSVHAKPVLNRLIKEGKIKHYGDYAVKAGLVEAAE